MGRREVRTLLAALALGCFHACEVHDPGVIQLYRNDTVNFVDTLFDFEDGPSRVEIRRDTLEERVFPNRDAQVWDSIETEVRVETVRLVAVRVFPSLWSRDTVYRLHLGTERSPKNPPDIVEKWLRTESESLRNLPERSETRVEVLDSYDTVYTVIAPVLNADSLSLAAAYPRMSSQGIALRNLRGDSLSTWSSWGMPRVNAGRDNLYLDWPADSAAFLGLRRGFLKVYAADSARAKAIPWSFERFFRNLTPPGEARTAYWDLVGRPGNFAEGENNFSLATGRIVDTGQQPRFDSLIHLRSRFRLKGNFDLEAVLRRPANSDGYTVMLFLSESQSPFFWWDTAGVQVLGELGGILINARRGSAVITARGFDARIASTGFKDSTHTRYRIRRSGTALKFSMQNLKSAFAREQDIMEFNYAQEPLKLPREMVLHFAVGNYQAPGAPAVTVEWENFAITQGEIAGP